MPEAEPGVPQAVRGPKDAVSEEGQGSRGGGMLPHSLGVDLLITHVCSK